MIILICQSHSIEWDWTAIGTLLLVFATFFAIYIQNSLFKKQRVDDNERAFKTSSVTLITDFDSQFTDLIESRIKVAKIIIKDKILEKDTFNYEILDKRMDDIYDFFDTLGYLVDQQYIKADLVHQYFNYWFSRYYEFYQLCEIKKLSKYGDTVWNNMPKLYTKLKEIEAEQLGREEDKLTKAELISFFEKESWEDL